MTSVKFFIDREGLYGFEISGHSTNNCDDTEGKLLCASISSAAYMAVNTITDIIGDGAKATVEDGYMLVKVQAPSDKTRAVLSGLRLHLEALSSDFKGKLRINTEV